MKLHDQAHGSVRCSRLALPLAVLAVVALAVTGTGSAATPTTADLRVTKTDSLDPVRVGATLTYAIRVENLGLLGATGSPWSIRCRRASTSSPRLPPPVVAGSRRGG